MRREAKHANAKRAKESQITHPAGTLSSNHDTKDRGSMKEKIRLQVDTAERYFDLAGVMMIALDTDGQVTLINRKACEVVGCSAKEAVGKNWFDNFIPPATRDMVKTVFRSLITGDIGPVEYFENPILTRKGKERLIAWHNTLLKDAKGRISGTLSSGNDITERKRLEDEIRALARFPAENPNPVLRLDRRGTVLSANEASKALLQDWSSGIGKASPKLWRDLAAAALSTGEVKSIDVEIGEKSYTFLIKPIREADYVNLYGRDITERKRMEEEMRVSEERYRRLFESSVDGIDFCDMSGRYLDVNDAFARMLGYAKEELKKLTYRDLTPSKWYEVEEGIFENQIIKRGYADPFEKELIKKDGTIIPVRNRSWRVDDDQGKPIGDWSITVDITELKRVEEELRTKERQLSSIYHNAADILFLVAVESNDHFRFISVNPSFLNVTGLREDQVAGKDIREVIPEPSLRLVLQNYRQTIQDNRTIKWEEVTIYPAGTKTGEVSITPILGGSYLVGTVHDLTERKLMEEEIRKHSEHLEELVAERTRKLAESEKRFRELADLLPQIVFEIDEKGYFTFVNRSGLARGGYTEEEIHQGLNAIQVVTENDRDKIMENIKHILAGKDSSGEEYAIKSADGSTFPVIIHSTRILKEGKPVGLRGIAVDITERKLMEEDLQKERERLEYLISSNPAAIYTAKPRPDFSDYDSYYLSNTITSITGFEPEEILGNPHLWNERIHPDDLYQFSVGLPKLWKENHHTFEYRFLHKDGVYRWIREEVKVIRNSDHEVRDLIGAFTDITSQKRLEEEILNAQRLAAIGEVTAMVGHDLRNPLQGIAGATGVLRMHLGGEADKLTLEMLQVLETDMAYSNRIITDLLDYSRVTYPALTMTSLKALVEESIQLIPTPNNVTVENQTEETKIHVDTTQMKRVFTNLIKNAYDAMPNGGRLTITSRTSEETVDITISDTGTGIPEHVKQKLWRGPVTTKAKGLGLGIAIAKKMIEAHAGSIQLEKSDEHGTVIKIKIPMRR